MRASLPWSFGAGLPGAADWLASRGAKRCARESVGIVSVPRPRASHACGDSPAVSRGPDYYAALLAAVQDDAADPDRTRLDVAAGERWQAGREERASRRSGKRDEKYARQRALAPLLPVSMRKCHRTRFVRGEDGGVTVSVDAHGLASYSGVVSCNRRSGCEHCGPRLLARDAELIEAVVREHGHDRTWMATLTLRHWRRCDLKALRRGLSDSFRALLAHRTWRKHPMLCDGGEYVAQVVRSLEVTVGEHGWHPHLHVLVLLPRALDDAARKSFARWLSAAWRRTVASVAGAEHRPTRAAGVDVSPCHQASYLAKLGLELADAGQSKRARNVKGASWRQLVTRWIEGGRLVQRGERGELLGDAGLIRGYLDGMLGAKVVTWSPGMKAHAEELAPEEAREVREVASVGPEAWDELRDRSVDGIDGRVLLLRAAETAAPGALQDAVDDVVARLTAPSTAGGSERDPPATRDLPNTYH